MADRFRDTRIERVGRQRIAASKTVCSHATIPILRTARRIRRTMIIAIALGTRIYTCNRRQRGEHQRGSNHDIQCWSIEERKDEDLFERVKCQGSKLAKRGGDRVFTMTIRNVKAATTTTLSAAAKAIKVYRWVNQYWPR
jgi:hypothetical protein